ncbi:MAG: hypothetical protein IKU72_05215 [Oscillospiraceae bacterium]|nr:hypothetical protein [Oscillospiraceae bacterium]
MDHIKSASLLKGTEERLIRCQAVPVGNINFSATTSRVATHDNVTSKIKMKYYTHSTAILPLNYSHTLAGMQALMPIFTQKDEIKPFCFHHQAKSSFFACFYRFLPEPVFGPIMNIF